jgi:hypothetical protein
MVTSQKDRATASYSGVVVIFQGRCEYVPVRSGENIRVFDSPERQPQHPCLAWGY